MSTMTERAQLQGITDEMQLERWIYLHTCPECQTPAPESHDATPEPAWDCAVCLAAK